MTADNGNSRTVSRRDAVALVDRQPPHDTNAESWVLGSIFLDHDKLMDAARLVTADDFYEPAHVKIFSAMLAMRTISKPPSWPLVAEYLKATGDYESVGGTAYCAKLANGVPHAGHVQYYSEIVAKHGLSRRVIAVCTDLLRDAFDGDESSELVRRLQSHAHALADSQSTGSRVVSLSESADEVATAIENPVLTAGINRAHWGLPSVDERLGPIMPGEVCVVAAQPGLGKSAFGFQMLHNSAEHDRPALFISLEMEHTELSARDLSRLTNIDSRQIRRGELSNEQRQQVRAGQQSIGRLPLYLWSPAVASLAEIRSVILREINKRGVRLAAIDYLSLIDVEKAERHNQRNEQIASICRGLKRLAKECSIPLVVLQQLNREADGAEPRLSHLRESAVIEHTADVVMFLHHGLIDKKPMPLNERLLLIPKFRSGPIGKITVGWNAARTEFTERPIQNNRNYEPAFDRFGGVAPGEFQ